MLWTHVPVRGRLNNQPAADGLVGVFGGLAGIAVSPRQATHDRVPNTRDPAERRHAMLEITTGFRQRERIHERSGQDDNPGHQAGAGRINALDRVPRLEHERPGHLCARQVESDVDEDGQEQQPAAPHARDSTPKGRLAVCSLVELPRC